jgi:MerR family copper efflux transcriptional regulator
MAATMTVGQAAQAAGLTRKAVRLYEERGLLPPAPRTTAGYRLYDQRDIDTLTFIRRARALDLPLNDIGAIVTLRRGGTTPVLAVGALERSACRRTPRLSRRRSDSCLRSRR